MIWTHTAGPAGCRHRRYGPLEIAVLAQSWRYTGQIATIQAPSRGRQHRHARGAPRSQAFAKGVQDAQAAAQTRAVAAPAVMPMLLALSLIGCAAPRRRTRCGGVPGESTAACAQRADAAGDVLGQCAAAYSDLAAIADRHANDARTLIEALAKVMQAGFVDLLADLRAVAAGLWLCTRGWCWRLAWRCWWRDSLIWRKQSGFVLRKGLM